MKPTLRILSSLLLATLMSAGSLAQAPPPNPVFVNDSAEAARMLRQARGDAVKNPSESIRLIQKILDEHDDTLHPDEAQIGRFTSVRQDAIELLSSNPELWKRYESVESKRANRLLEEGRLRRLVNTRSMTTAGLEALLMLAQQNLEMGRLATATSYLDEALMHPQITDRDRWSATMMAAMAAHASSDVQRHETHMRELEDAGEDARLWLDAMRRFTRSTPPERRRGRNSIDDAIEPIGETTWPALWSNDFQRVPAKIRARNEFDSDRIAMDLSEGRLTAVVPSIVGDRIVFNEGGEVVEIDLLTGREIWRTSILEQAARADRIDDPIGPTAVAVDENDVVAWTGYSREGGVSETDDVVCLDLKTGGERWRFNLSETPGIDDAADLYPAGPPVIHEDRVLVLIRRERRQKLKSVYLLALDRLDGTPVFTSYIASTSSQSDGLRPLTMPVVDGGDILVSTSIGAVACVDIASGRIKWLQRMATPVSSTLATSRVRPYQLHRPLVFEDQVISLTPDYRGLVRLDRESGRILERMSLEDQSGRSRPAYLLTDKKRVYVIGSSIVAFDPRDLSRVLWTKWPRPGARSTPLSGRVHVAGNQLLVPTGEQLQILDGPTGRLLDSLDLEGSSIPLISDGHLLATSPNGMALHADIAVMSDALSKRLAERPGELESILGTARLAARSGDTDALLDQSSLLAESINRMDRNGRTDEIRKLVFEEIRDQIRSGSFDPVHVERIQPLLTSLTSGTTLDASARIALGEWQMDFDMPSAIVQWQMLSSDPTLSAQLHEADGILAPAGEWSRNRMTKIAESNPELVEPMPERALNGSNPWGQRLADLASNLRNRGGSDRVATQTLQILKEAENTSRTEAGLEILDLWSSFHQPADNFPDGRTASEWRTRLLAAGLPEIPRGVEIGGRSLRWPGVLVPAINKSAQQRLSRDGFLRSFDDTLSWHAGPDLDPRWTVELPGNEVSISWQDDERIVVQLAKLGRPRRLVCLSLADGRREWDLILPDDAFPEQMPNALEKSRSPLNTASWVAVEPVDDRMILIHQDGRTTAFDIDGTTEPVWSATLPDHFIQDHAPWQNGVAVIGYRSIDASDPWLNRGPQQGDMILGWFDAGTGDVQWIDLPMQIGAASWLESNEIGDLIVGGTNGAALYRNPGKGPSWISQDRSLQTSRLLDGIDLTARILQTTDLQYDREAFSLETGRKLELDPLPDRPFRTGMPKIHGYGDSQSLLFDKMILMLDSSGQVMGSSAGSRAMNHRFDEAIPFLDGLAVLDQIDPRLHSAAGRSSARHFYQIQIISPDGKGVEILDLFPLDSRIRAGRAMHGTMLLTTEDEVIAITLPPAIDAP
ncbi:MAG: hypothetical protein CMJ40_04845 [Phycisphaerae bacterium]|nr:hypothetical protein [Phycisphaerae bacterium]